MVAVLGIADLCLLVAEKEERLVADDRAPNHAAELIAFELVADGGKVVASIEYGITVEFEEVAVECIGAAGGDRIHDRAGIAAITSCVIARLHAELLQRIRKRKGLVDIGIDVVVRRAVEV